MCVQRRENYVDRFNDLNLMLKFKIFKLLVFGMAIYNNNASDHVSYWTFTYFTAVIF